MGNDIARQFGHLDEADPLLVAGLRRLERDDTDDAERRKATGG